MLISGKVAKTLLTTALVAICVSAVTTLYALSIGCREGNPISNTLMHGLGIIGVVLLSGVVRSSFPVAGYLLSTRSKNRYFAWAGLSVLVVSCITNMVDAVHNVVFLSLGVGLSYFEGTCIAVVLSAIAVVVLWKITAEKTQTKTRGDRAKVKRSRGQPHRDSSRVAHDRALESQNGRTSLSAWQTCHQPSAFKSLIMQGLQYTCSLQGHILLDIFQQGLPVTAQLRSCTLFSFRGQECRCRTT